MDATISAAFVAALVAVGTIVWQRRTDVVTTRNALFAELRHIRQHYRYAGLEMPKSLQDRRELEKRLKWSRFGELHSVKDLGRFAILGAKEMQLLLQVSSRIRNTDQLIDMLLSEHSVITEDDLEEVIRRTEYISRSAELLVEFMKEQDSRLSSIPEPEQ